MPKSIFALAMQEAMLFQAAALSTSSDQKSMSREFDPRERLLREMVRCLPFQFTVAFAPTPSGQLTGAGSERCGSSPTTRERRANVTTSMSVAPSDSCGTPNALVPIEDVGGF
jgi:hypothetical protein